jgi:hypothetical protein
MPASIAAHPLSMLLRRLVAEAQEFATGATTPSITAIFALTTLHTVQSARLGASSGTPTPTQATLKHAFLAWSPSYSEKQVNI